MQSAIKNIFKKILKVTAWVAGSLIFLLLLATLLIQIPAVQLKLTQKAVSFLEEKIGTSVSLEGIRIRFPKSIVLEGIYLEDQQGDTLLYAGQFSINTDLWALTRHEVQLNDVSLEHAIAFVDRTENDSSFNFTYILDAFAGDSTAVPDTLEQKGWDFTVKDVDLEHLRMHYDDRLTGNRLNLSLGIFNLAMNEVDLKNNIYRAGAISLKDTRANLEQTKLPHPEESAQKTKSDSSATLLLSLEEIALENVHVSYAQSALGRLAELDLGEAMVTAETVDLVDQQIDLKRVSLKKTRLAYQQKASDAALPSEEQSNQVNPATKPWRISIEALDLEDNDIQFNDFRKPVIEGAVDFNHLSVTDFDINARDISYSDSLIAATFGNLSFNEQSGFALKSFRGKIEINETGATLSDFLLMTTNSRLQLEATASFPSLQRMADTYRDTRLSANISDSYINLRDILYFQPSLTDSLPLQLSPHTDLQIDAAVTGALSNLRIDHLIFRSLSDTYLKTSGTLSGLPDEKHLLVNLSLQKFHTTRADLKNILADTLLPDSLQLPAWINIEGGFRGTTKKATFKTLLTSDAGSVDLNGKMNLDSASALRGLEGTIRIEGLDLGTILGKPDSVMGKLSMQADLQTTGLSLREMNGTLNGVIGQFDFQGYRYTDLKLNGSIRNGMISAAAGINDKNLEFTLAGKYDLNREIPTYHVTLDLRNADFEALHLSQSPIRARGTLQVNLATRDFQVMNGNVDIRKVAIFNGDKLYAVDSLLFASIDQEGYSEINIDSDLLTADFEGSINLFGLPAVMKQYFNSYYKLHDSLEVQRAASQHFSFDIKLKNTDMLTGLLIPKLTSFVPGEIRGEFDSERKKLDLQLKINEFQYSNIGLRSFAFKTSSDSTSLRYDVTVDKIFVDSMKVDGLEFNGTVAHDSIRTNLIILDSAEVHKYVLAGTLFSRDKGFELTLLPKGTVLNYQKWQLPADNYMRFGGQKFIAENVEFTNRREKLIIQAKEQPGSPVLIGFRELNLEYLSSVIAEEKPLSGLLQGDIRIYPDTAAMAFTSDITIEDFRLSKVLWGDIVLKVDQKIRNRFDVAFSLAGNRNDVQAEGFYTNDDSRAVDLTATIRSFNLESLQPVLGGQLEDLKGDVSGEIKVKGSVDRPDIDGSISIDDTHFASTYLNTSFSIDGQSISFVDEGISFDQFEITDDSNNHARLDGTVLTKTYRDFEFNLNVTSDHFRLLNTTKEDNDLFYGRLDVRAHAMIRGTLTTPIVTMDVGLSKGSNLTYVVPQSEASVLQTEGIVKFVDKTFEGDPFMKKIGPEAEDTVKSAFRGMNLTARVELTDQERFSIVIDPLTQDQLAVRGNSTLTLQIDPTGDIHLTGRYEIVEGTYNLSFYKFVRREFEIEKGSTITWLGDPLNGRMDIRAIYKVETSPIELFSNQLTGADRTDVNRYKQALPFLVYLDLSGELLQPEIAFELQMPMASRNAIGGSVYARLQDINTRESDLSKQVFALLILKRFIADDPFENQAPGGFESTARRSVSKILSEQLNRLAKNIKGIELSFDIKSYEDYSSGQARGQTELQLGVSKSLFNDRLVVKLSGNVDMEDGNSNREATDYIGDLALEYKVTPDGRLRITGFRNSDYDMIDGELTETGAGLIYVKDYNTLSQLFKPNAQIRN